MERDKMGCATVNTIAFSFKDQVELLSSYLRTKYGMTVVQHESNVIVRNDVTILRFSPGDIRDQYVSTTISYVDDNIFRQYGKMKSVEIWRYAKFKNIDPQQFYPDALTPSVHHRRPDIPDKGPFSFIESPFQVLADIIFLSVHGDPLLSVHRDEIRKFGEWLKKTHAANGRTIA